MKSPNQKKMLALDPIALSDTIAKGNGKDPKIILI